MYDFDIVAATYTHLIDVYKQFDSQDTNTGAIKKEWHYDRTVKCYAKGVISNRASSRSGDRQEIAAQYKDTQYVEIRSTDKISLREKITNIRTEHGVAIWTELNFPDNTPTVFEIIGTTPMTDPFGDVLAWNTTLKRSENQVIGL